MYEVIPLSLLAPGEQAQVDHVAGQPELVHHLKELGFRDGAAIEMVQGGSPCIIRLAGQKLCFRGDELLSVLVRLEASR